MKKFLPYILITLVFVGAGLISAPEAVAATPNGGLCYFINAGVPSVGNANTFTKAHCDAISTQHQWLTDEEIAAGKKPNIGGDTDSFTFTPQQQTDFEKVMASRSCVSWSGADIPWCFVVVADLVFHTVPAFLLAKVAYFFNVLISISLDGEFLKQDFVSDAWVIVRDLSNIFFILILLYIAIKIILDLGGSEAKEMIVKVIIIALLINFSMFFTKMVIDTSNIIALIFYNKISLTTKDASGKVVNRPYDSIGGEKDVAGGMVAAFDPTVPLKKAFFDESAKIYYTDPATGVSRDTGRTGDIPAGTMIAIILISGLIMGFAIYALFVSGLSFLGRLIELWVLIIFSPFAFMSYAVPKLGSIEYLGWNAWFKRLVSVSFMASIFMFFLYFIFLLVGSNIFKEIVKPTQGATSDPASATRMLLGVVMPAIFICILLLKATDFAKKGSGKFGETITKMGGQIGGLATTLALGAATGGAAVVGRATLGRMGSAVANSERAVRWEREGKFGAAALRNVGKAAGAGSFDVRGVKIAGKTLASATGIPLGEAQKGGFETRKKEQIEKRVKRAEELEKGVAKGERHGVTALEIELRAEKARVATQLSEVDKEISDLRQKMQDQRAAGLDVEAALTYSQLEAKQNARKVIRGVDPATGARTTGGVADLEKRLNEANDRVNAAVVREMGQYATHVESLNDKLLHSLTSLGQYSWAGADKAAEEIRKGVKIETPKK